MAKRCAHVERSCGEGWLLQRECCTEKGGATTIPSWKGPDASAKERFEAINSASVDDQGREKKEKWGGGWIDVDIAQKH